MTGQRRTDEQWQQLITEFEAGDEGGKAFCQRHSISTANFYKRRSRIIGRTASSFVSLRHEAPSASPVVVQIGEFTIRCDTQTSVAWVADLAAMLRG